MAKNEKFFEEYEQLIVKEMHQWVTLTFCLTPHKYWPRLSSPHVIYDYSKSFELGPRYLHLQALKTTFTASLEDIMNEVEKIGNGIYGVRFLKSIGP